MIDTTQAVTDAFEVLEVGITSGWRATARQAFEGVFKKYAKFAGKAYAGDEGAVRVQEKDEAQRRIVIGLDAQDGQSARIAIMLERGKDPYDLRDTVLRSKGRDAVNIPFDKTESMAMTYVRAIAGDDRFGATPKARDDRVTEVSAALKGMKRSVFGMDAVTKRNRMMEKGDRFSAGQVPKINEGLHTADPLARAVAYDGTYQDKQFTTYRIWRRMTLDGDPAKWQHPGFPAMGLREKYMESEQFKTTVQAAANAYALGIAKALEAEAKGAS